ncbi:competence type IV pilus minor pilin ComGF [Mesobacillus maritimus]|uniref:competence type IV pilus minor pilin ComGF n=1 Tax=Mesobacillus maritimus TaxID=1643336 RepID=UPI0038516E6C
MVIFPRNDQNVPLQNEKGFTLVEMLIAFMAFCMLASFFPLAIQTVASHKYLDQRNQRLEWEVFLSQVKKETRLSSQVTVLGDKLLLQKNGDTILYEKYGSNLRRRVNYTGHETLLQNVASVRFIKTTGGFSIYVQDLEQIEYSATIRSFISLEVK